MTQESQSPGLPGILGTMWHLLTLPVCLYTCASGHPNDEDALSSPQQAFPGPFLHPEPQHPLLGRHFWVGEQGTHSQLVTWACSCGAFPSALCDGHGSPLA